MNRGRGAHDVPRVKDVCKREVSFSRVPSNLGKRGKVCRYSARRNRDVGIAWNRWLQRNRDCCLEI